jgi:C4-dicarboxylate-specific signal transduction histidine kinase
VTDNGKGMPQETIDMLTSLKPIQAGSTRKGLGMGLLIAQAIVDNFGGTLKVGVSDEKGTTMKIELPITSLSSTTTGW